MYQKWDVEVTKVQLFTIQGKSMTDKEKQAKRHVGSERLLFLFSLADIYYYI